MLLASEDGSLLLHANTFKLNRLKLFRLKVSHFSLTFSVVIQREIEVSVSVLNHSILLGEQTASNCNASVFCLLVS